MPSNIVTDYANDLLQYEIRNTLTSCAASSDAAVVALLQPTEILSVPEILAEQSKSSTSELCSLIPSHSDSLTDPGSLIVCKYYRIFYLPALLSACAREKLFIHDNAALFTNLSESYLLLLLLLLVWPCVGHVSPPLQPCMLSSRECIFLFFAAWVLVALQNQLIYKTDSISFQG